MAGGSARLSLLDSPGSGHEPNICAPSGQTNAQPAVFLRLNSLSCKDGAQQKIDEAPEYTTHMSSFNNPTLPREFDHSKLCFTDAPKPMGTQGGKLVSVSYDGNPLLLETDHLHVPYDIGQFEDAGGKTKFSLAMSFKNRENNEKIELLYSAMTKVDDAVLDAAVVNCQSWFKKTMSREILTALYTPTIRYARDRDTGDVLDKYPPTFSVKMPVYDGILGAKVYDMDRTVMTIPESGIANWAPRGSTVKALVRFSGLWFAGGKFGPMWRLVAAQAKPPAEVDAFCFRDAPPVPVEQIQVAGTRGGVPVSEQSSDSEGDDAIQVP